MVNKCLNFARYEKKVGSNISVLFGLKSRDGYYYKYIGFNKFENKETKLPEGYKRISMKKDIVKKYFCDESKKLLNIDNIFYKNIKNKYRNCKKYFIHHNYSNPFLVYVCKNNVDIYGKSNKYYIDDQIYKSNFPWMYINLIKSYKPLKIFIGKSPINKMTKFSKGYGPKFDGNTILLYLGNDNYIFIGSEIKLFKNKSKIEKYISPIGNNDVPYPYAIDENNDYFLMIENKVIKNIPKKYKNDPYDFYYGNKNINNITKIRPIKLKIIHKML